MIQNVQDRTAAGKVEGMMGKVVAVTEARKKLSYIVEQVQYQGNSYVISRYGRPAAAVVPVEVYENWQRQREQLFELMRELQKEAHLSPEEADQLAAEAVAAVRAQS